jgi:hypothetical protein
MPSLPDTSATEIRNAIYSQLSSSAYDDLRASYGTEVKLIHKKNYSQHWPSLRREDLGLTQTCHQIRREYFPIYSRHTRMYVCMRDFANAAEDLCRTKHQVSMPAGNVLVGVRTWNHLPPPLWEYHLSDIDISPLLHLCKINPDLHFTFEDASPYFTALFDVHTNPLWWDFLNTAVWEVRVWPEFWDGSDYPKHTKVHIEVDKAFGERWMKSRSKRRNPKVDRWLGTVGLQDLEGWDGMRVYWARGWFDMLFSK